MAHKILVNRQFLKKTATLLFLIFNTFKKRGTKATFFSAIAHPDLRTMSW